MNSTQKAAKILQLIQEEAMTCFPLLAEAFGLLQHRESGQDKLSFLQHKELVPDSLTAEPIAFNEALNEAFDEAVLETDGTSLYYHAERVCALFRETPSQLRWMYLHLYLHYICEHPWKEPNSEHADIVVSVFAYLLVESQIKKGVSSRTPIRSLFSVPEQLRSIFEKVKPRELTQAVLHPEKLPAVLEPAAAQAEYTDLYARFRSDSHTFWPINNENTASSSRARVSVSNHQTPQEELNKNKKPKHPFFISNSLELSMFHKQYLREKLQKALLSELATGFGKRGWAPGRSAEEADLQKQDSMDYHSFLQRFTVPREEALIDTDSFDYIPYHYGLTYYGNLPFIEPLEYKEVNRLDELAIAIDTSGSCSGRIVRRFLEETWSILRQRENFFSRMRLHLIQCDSMIQEYRIFSSVEEWEEAIPNFRILGLGNTDFCPVFELLEKQIQSGEIRQLRGLLYFTDGDGIFPRSAPTFDTAFVFLSQATEKHEIPDWGIRLNLNLSEEF